MIFETMVNGFVIPVKRARCVSMVYFYGGAHGKSEAGQYCFWTAVYKRPVKGKRKTIGRAHAVLGPGARFERMRDEARRAKLPEDRAAYRELWENHFKQGANIDYIRPSTAAEIVGWMKRHPADALHASRLLIGGRRHKFLDWS